MQCPILCPCRVRRTKCDWIEPFKANCIVNICHCRVCVRGRFRVVENVRGVVVYSSPSTCKYFAVFKNFTLRLQLLKRVLISVYVHL